MSLKIHKTADYQKLAIGISDRFMTWNNRRWSIKTPIEIEDLKRLSLQAYKLAKHLEKLIEPKQDELQLFNDCALNKHTVKTWEVTGNTTSGKPILKGECSMCLAEIVNYGDKDS